MSGFDTIATAQKLAREAQGAPTDAAQTGQPQKAKRDNLPLAVLTLDPACQPRAQIDHAIVAEYAERMGFGDEFPPVVAFYDGTDYWLADGWHRLEAADNAKLERIAVDVRPGTRRDAILYAAGANGKHGLRRTNEDKRRAVATLLNDPEWMKWPNTDIAIACGVSEFLVRSMRPEPSSIKSKIEDAASPGLVTREVTRGGKTYEMNVSGIGKSAQSPQLGGATEPASPATGPGDGPKPASAWDRKFERQRFRKVLQDAEWGFRYATSWIVDELPLSDRIAFCRRCMTSLKVTMEALDEPPRPITEPPIAAAPEPQPVALPGITPERMAEIDREVNGRGAPG